MHVFDKFIYLRVAFATDIEKIVFLTFLLIRRSLVNFMSQGMSFRKAVQPIGRGLLFSYPLIKVYQSLPNGMKDDGTRSFMFELRQLGMPKTIESRRMNYCITMKRGIIWMLVALCLGLMVNCGGSSSESSQTHGKSVGVAEISLNELLQTKEVLKTNKIDREREQKIESIIDEVGDDMRSNIKVILKENLHRQKTSVEEKAISVVPMLDNTDKSIIELETKFRNGKVSSFSIEAMINNKIESYNDEHLYNRLHTVSLDLFPTNKMGIDSLYHRLVSKEWKNEQNSIDLVNQVMIYYGKMLQSNRVLEQMIGIE